MREIRISNQIRKFGIWPGWEGSRRAKKCVSLPRGRACVVSDVNGKKQKIQNHCFCFIRNASESSKQKQHQQGSKKTPKQIALVSPKGETGWVGGWCRVSTEKKQTYQKHCCHSYCLWSAIKENQTNIVKTCLNKLR